MDDESFRHLYDRTAIGLRKYLRHVVGDRSLADDIMQEAYFRILKATLPQGMDASQQKNYLYKIAANPNTGSAASKMGGTTAGVIRTAGCGILQ